MAHFVSFFKCFSSYSVSSKGKAMNHILPIRLTKVFFFSVSLLFSCMLNSDWFSPLFRTTLQQCSLMMWGKQDRKKSRWKVWSRRHYGLWFNMHIQVIEVKMGISSNDLSSCEHCIPLLDFKCSLQIIHII